MSSLWSAFNKAAFSSIVVDPTYSLLPEHKARDVLRDALDHIKRLSLAERQQGADIVAAKFRLCTLSELDVIVQCILSHTFVVECLGISGSNDKLLHAFTNLCNHVLDHYSLNVFVSKLRDATANKVISAKTCECLLIMAFSKKETVWMRRRMLPAHHNHTLTHALMLLCLKQAFSDKRTNGIPILDSWMLETTKSLLSPNQASNINLLLNVERIVRVLGGLDMLSFDQTGTLLNLIVRYIVLIARLQRKTSIYDFMDSTSRIRSTAVSVSTAFGCLLTSDIFFSFLASAPDNASKGFLDGMVNEIVSPTILSDTATMVCGTILNLNQAGKAAIAEAMLSILVKKVSTIGAPSVVKQQLWESMYGNLTMHAILQTTVIAELQDPQGLLLVDSLPLSVLISICEKSPYLQESSIMARLFTNLGNSLLIAVKNSLHNPIRALDSLGIFDQLLLRHFRPQINNATDVDRFLEPIVWVVTGVNAQVSVSRTQYGRTDVAMKDTLLAVPWCFLYLLRIYLHNVELSTLTGAESHIASVWWSKVSQALTKKVFENPALQVMFQQSLEVFTSPGKSSFFDVLSVLEGRKDVIGSSLPAMYATLSGALGEALHRLNFAKYSSNYAPNAREHTVTSCVEKCIEVLPQQTTTSSQIGICYVSYSYMKASLDNFLLYMREEKYVMPRCLLGLFGALGRTDVEHLHQHVAQYLEDMIILKTAIQDHLSKTIEDIHDADVPVKDLDVIAKNMDDIKSTCQALSIQLDKLMTLDIDLLVGNYQIALQDAKELNKVILFLHQRNLCPRFAELRDALDNNGNNSVTVKGMLETVLAVSSKLGLDDFNVLRALRAFAGNSDLFVHHFGKVEMKVQLSEQEAKQEVIGRTRHALDNLALLVSNENIRIEDFFAADIAGLVSELQRTGQGHSHRQRKMEHELEAIAQFFGSEKNSKGQTVGKLATSLERLNAAFHLVKLKEILPAFLLAMKELKLGHLLDGNTSNLVSLLLKELSDNFFIKDGPGIRTRLDSALSGLRQIDLVIISKLASSEELSAGLMLQIFARFSSESAFDQALEHAQNQASGNPVAGKLLLKLRGLRTVLRPFWNNSYAGSLQFLTDHMLKEVRVVSGHGGELLCPTLEELTNVIEHWPECEICFRDGGSSSSGFGDIARLVQVYQRFGHFVSSLSAHPGGPYLSFTYNDKIGNQVLLSPQVLQEHVQWAVLGASGNDETHEAAADQKCLDQFIAAFGLAEKLQNLCLQLEASGHPDFQSLSCMPNMPLAQSCNCDALCQQLAALRAILDDWQFSVKLGCKESLRLCMLSQKARVHFFLALRGWGSLSTRLRSEAFLSYVLQCFPSHLSARNALDQATALALTEYQEQSSLFESDWKRAFSLLQHVETTLDAKIEVDSTLIGLIVRFELLGLSDFEVYCAVLSINMTENRGIMNLPTAVLWCSQESTSENIQDFLSAACSGVSASVYVIAVNRLLPRVREELLGGLQSKGLRSQVALIFTEQDGLDACQQYRLEIQASNVCNNQYLDNYRQAMWPVFSRPATLRQGEFCELSVCVVGGRTGTGKSFWINRQIFKLKKCMKLTVVVHEGFNIMDVIDQVEKGFADRENSNVVVVLHVVVTTVANLSLLQGFLHNLFYSGLLYDPKTGKAFACTERTKVVLYVELPSLAKTDTMSAWPEAGDVWQTKDHPYLVHLPCLQVCVLHKNFINIRSADRFYVVNNEKARFVAACLHIYRSNNNNVDAVSLPSLLENDEFVTSIGPNNCANILTDFFDNKQFSRSKRSRNNAILVMYDKFRVISSFQHQMHLEMELGGDSEEVFFVAKYCGKVTAYFELAIYESFCIAREDCSLGTSSVQLIIPSWDDTDDVLPVESQLEVLVISNTAGVTAQALAGLTVDMPSHTLIRTFNEVSPEELAKLRSLIAPLFGMRNSALMCRNLIDAGHLLTAESLAGVLHLHGRRSIRANVLYEGETGCGKTQTLKLYANLINANTSLFTNLKFQMLAVLRIIVDDTLSNSPLHVDDVFTTEDVAAFENAGKRILDIDVMSASTTKLVQSTMDWLALGPLDLINSIGALVCAYFCLVFQQFPLYSDGCDELIMSKFTECSNWISKHEDYKTKVLDICARAAHTDFLVGVGNVSAHVLQGSIWSNSPAEESTLQGLPALELFSDGDDLKLFMQGLLNCKSSSLYFRLLADEGLSAYKWREFIAEVSNAANRVSELSASAVVCVFIDECNTSGAFGIVCEAFAWHTIHGEPLPSNLFLVGAINPYRTTSLTIPAMQFTKSNIDVGYQKDEVEEDSLDYLAHIPYIVKPLPPCMESLVVRYPNLSQLAETMFLREYIQQHITIPASAYINEIVWERQMQHFSNFVVLLVSRAQEIVRSFRIQRMYMSIRNLIRTIQLLDWYLNFQVSTSSLEPDVQVNIFLPEVKHANFHGSGRKKLTMTHSIVMAVAVSYMLQLPSEGHVAAGKVLEDFRQRFLRELAVFCTGIDNDWADELFGKAGRSVNAFVQHWTAIVKGALEHLWSFAKIPKGLAKTDAVMEVFYANIIAAENRMSLLVSGPPGCGKTLSFNLACDNLRGPSHQHTLAFQQLKKATKFMYQCSRSSTGPEIASRFLEAKEHQKDLDSRQPGKHVCIVGLDEAGLPPENRQALKSIHDDLESRIVAAVMMSNTILDAAKTSRMLLIMQTQTNLIDLTQLAEGLLIDDDAMKSSPPSVVKYWKKTVLGLCRAFFSVSEVIKTNNWFHSRDFVYLCRLLRRQIDECAPVATLFDAKMLVEGLRRNMQPLDSALFGTLANHFLMHCCLDYSSVDGTGIGPYITESLIDAVNDTTSNVSDFATAHCRYAMIVDPTDCEAAIDLVFALNILDAANTKVVSVSDFPDDSTPTKHTAVLGQIKRAIEAGVCLLLKNSSLLQSALYDVINRHYVVSIKEDPSNPGHMIKEAHANIALGSFSRYVKVNPNFRLIVHVPASQLGSTPLPFLNRLEKYPLSIRSALDKRVAEIALYPPSCLRILNSKERCVSFFRAVQMGAEDFVQKLGGASSFYGFALDEVIPAWILRSIAPEALDCQLYFNHEPSLMAIVLGVYRQKHETPVSKVESVVEDNPIDNLTNILDGGIALQLKTVIRQVNFQLLNSARLDVIFRLRKKLPRCYIAEYIDKQEHLTGTSLLRKLAWWSFRGCLLIATPTPLKLIAYTRTDTQILRLAALESLKALCRHVCAGEDFECNAVALQEDDRETAENLPKICESLIVVVTLSSFSTEQSCERAIHSAMQTDSGPRLLLVIADMKTCTPNQVTMARRMVDLQYSSRRQKMAEVSVGVNTAALIPTVLFFLHCASSMLHLRPCYQSVPLNDWEAVYVDSFSHSRCDDSSADEVHFSDSTGNYDTQGESKESTNDAAMLRPSSLDADWLRIAFGICHTCAKSEIYKEFGRAIRGSLESAVKSCNFHQAPRLLAGGKRLGISKYLSSVGLELSFPAYQDNNKAWVFDLITSRSYIERTLMESFAILWAKLVEQRVEDGCARVLSGATTLGLIADIRASQTWLLSDFLRLVIARDLSSDWSLEALAMLSAPVQTDQWEYLVDLEVNELVENLANESFGTISIASASLIALVLRSSILVYPHNLYGRDYGFISISAKTDRASLLPLFCSLVSQVRDVMPAALTASRKKGKWAQQVCVDEDHLRKLLTLHNYKDLSKAIAIIEHKGELWQAFKVDFVAIILGFGCYHDEEELSLLATAAEHSIALSTHLSSSRFAYSDCSQRAGNLVKWILQKQRIKEELNDTFRLLRIARRFVSVNKFLNTLSVNPSLPLVQMNSLLLSELSMGLWVAFVGLVNENFQEGAQLRDWTIAMRDLLHSDVLSPKSRVPDEPAKYASSFAVVLMVLYFKIKTCGWCTPPCLQLEANNDTNDPAVGNVTCYGVIIQVSSSDILKSVLVLLWSVSHLGTPKQVSELLVETLLWVLQEPMIYTSSDCCVPVVAGLLGIDLSMSSLAQSGTSTSDIASTQNLFQNLTLTARSEIFRHLLSIDRNRTEGIVLALAESVGYRGDAAVVPSIASSALTDFVISSVIPLSDEDISVPNCHPLLGLAEQVIVHSLHVDLLLTDFANNIRECIRKFQQVSSVSSTSLFQKLLCGVYSLHLLELISEFLIRGDAFKTPLPSLQRANLLSALVHITSICPCAMGLFFLSRFDMTISLCLLQDSAFLQALGLSWLQTVAVEPLPSEATGEKVSEYVAITKDNQTKITAVYFAQIAVNNAMQHQFWKLPTLNELLASSCLVNGDNLQYKCRDFCQHLLDFDKQDCLEANKHFSSILRLYQFAREKFAYCFTNADEVRMLPFDQALTILSVEERLEGRKLLMSFIESWNQLRNLFVTFVICAREVGAAAEIPLLTDSKGVRPVLLGDIVELGDTSEHESLPARMLEQRLLKTINDTLSNDAVVQALRADLQFNPAESIIAVDASDEFLSRVSLDYDCSRSVPQLLTGIRTDGLGRQHLESLLIAHSYWEGESLVLPSFLPEEPSVNWTVLLEETRARAGREAQQMAHNASFILCPRCNMLSERREGCDNLTCGSPDNAYGDRATARGNTLGDLGCGMRLHAINHRVPPPGDAPLPAFLPTRAPIDLSTLPSAVPAPPAVRLPTGGRVVDFVPVARYLFARIFVGRVRINIDNDFFAPLPFRFTTKDQCSLKKEDKVVEHMGGSVEVGQSLTSSPPQEVFLRLRLRTNQLRAILHSKGGTDSASLDARKSERIKVIANRMGEAVLAAQCRALELLILHVLIVMKDNEGAMEYTGDFLRVDCQELTEGKGMETLSPLLLPLTVGELISVGSIFAEIGMESGGVVYPPSLSVDMPRVDKENYKTILSEVRTMEREGKERVLSELKELGGMLAQIESSLLLCPSHVLLCDVPTLSGFLAGKLLSQRLLGGVKVCHWGGTMKGVRRLIGEITLALLDECSGETGNKQEAVNGPNPEDNENVDVYQELIPSDWQWEACAIGSKIKEARNEEDADEGLMPIEETEEYSFEEDYAPQEAMGEENVKPRGLWEAAVNITRRTIFPPADQYVEQESDEERVETGNVDDASLPPPPPTNQTDTAIQPSTSPPPAEIIPPRPPAVVEWGEKVAWSFLSFWRSRQPALAEVIANLESEGLSSSEDLRYLDRNQRQEIAVTLPLVPRRWFYWALGILDSEGGGGQVHQFVSPEVIIAILQSASPPVVSILQGHGVLLDVSTADQPHALIEQLGILTREELEEVASSFPLLRARKFRVGLWGQW